ncbi:MAG: bifunctional alpha,alpha-trehalose-phosphate synthase (UDP-forming)/trehalose-phosphatase [Proteobacteria bacterium]|nr:bifunctional alpha,alpha-trehalose-phosphate synthase (UDP-forming)/trehalose-phosphatase [Pseudomonadota bacterium]
MSPSSENPILVIANRLPVTLSRSSRGLERRHSTGGLVSALDPLLTHRGGTWVGWPGTKLREGEQLARPDDPYPMVPVELSASEVNRYYHGFSNATLWPLFHSLPDRARFDRHCWDSYETVNRRFAEVAAEWSDGAELVWVHDYQLLRTPLHLRRIRPDARIAYFLHIPFPPYDLFRLLPWDRELLRGLLAADLVGFHVRGYAQNFLECVERLLAQRVDRDSGLIEHGERTVQVEAFPIGIDFRQYEQRAMAVQQREPRREKVVLGVDRLDYTKGISQRLRAFERLLEMHPEHREKVVLLQLAVPSRDQVSEYQQLKREIDELVGRINGRFATSGWSPIQYLYRSLPPERLSQLYRDSDVALITPLRDGMNLVAKEFVASQVDDPGVLVLSRLAGAAETMREAILVNPFDIDGTAGAVHRALTMDEAERRSRIVALRRRERRNSVDLWANSFLAGARAAGGKLAPPADSEFDAWVGEFLRGYHLALFLDYDGTLARIADHPSAADLSPGMRDALVRCASRDDTDVGIVSGRSLDDVSKMVGLEPILYAGNHGLEIEGPGIRRFTHEDLGHYRQRLQELARDLEETCIPGAWVEEKGASLTFHYREADETQHVRLAEEAQRKIRAAGFQSRQALCAVEARPPIGWDKGHAVLHILRTRYGPAWSASVRPVYAGDDETDEDVFRVLSGLGRTFRVGSADVPTTADRQLADVDAVLAMLQYLARR